MSEATEKIEKGILPLVEGLGCRLVEVAGVFKGGHLLLQVTIFKERGVDLFDCEKVHAAIYPVVSSLAGDRYPRIEVLSPGVTRALKTLQDYQVFEGKEVKVLLTEAPGWKVGTIGKVQPDDRIEFFLEGELRLLKIGEIRKARLNFGKREGV